MFVDQVQAALPVTHPMPLDRASGCCGRFGRFPDGENMAWLWSRDDYALASVIGSDVAYFIVIEPRIQVWRAQATSTINGDDDAGPPDPSIT